MLPLAMYWKGAVILFRHIKTKSGEPGTPISIIRIGPASESTNAKGDLRRSVKPRNGSEPSWISRAKAVTFYFPV